VILPGPLRDDQLDDTPVAVVVLFAAAERIV
jgi:hypothetical protein